jgi:hypothetical protein
MTNVPEQCDCGGKIRGGSCRDCGQVPPSPVDALMAEINKLSGAEFDELRTRVDRIAMLNAYGLEEFGDAVVLVLGHDAMWRIDQLDAADDPEGHSFASYPEALAEVRRIFTADSLDPERVKVVVYSLLTGNRIDLPPLPEIEARWDRAVLAEHERFFALAAGAGTVEAFCALCGESCNPHGPDDMTHLERADGEPCGGPLMPSGWWG